MAAQDTAFFVTSLRVGIGNPDIYEERVRVLLGAPASPIPEPPSQEEEDAQEPVSYPPFSPPSSASAAAAVPVIVAPPLVAPAGVAEGGQKRGREGVQEEDAGSPAKVPRRSIPVIRMTRVEMLKALLRALTSQASDEELWGVIHSIVAAMEFDEYGPPLLYQSMLRTEPLSRYAPRLISVITREYPSALLRPAMEEGGQDTFWEAMQKHFVQPLQISMGMQVSADTPIAVAAGVAARVGSGGEAAGYASTASPARHVHFDASLGSVSTTSSGSSDNEGGTGNDPSHIHSISLTPASFETDSEASYASRSSSSSSYEFKPPEPSSPTSSSSEEEEDEDDDSDEEDDDYDDAEEEEDED